MAGKTQKSKGRQRATRTVLKEDLPPQPTTSADRQAALAHGNQRALLAEVSQVSQGLDPIVADKQELRRMIEEALASYNPGPRAVGISPAHAAPYGASPMAPQSMAPDLYQVTRQQINEAWERVLVCRKELNTAISAATAADPHDPGHIEVLNRLRDASQDYIFASQDIIRAANFNSTREPLGQAQGAQVNG